jgi:glucokinase
MRACIDIGGTKVAVSLAADAPGADGLPSLQARRSEPTVTTGEPTALAQQVLRLVDEACTAAGVAPASVLQAGVSSCGPFVLEAGQLALAAPNLCGGIAGPARGLPNHWTALPLQVPLAQRFRHLRIENDCIAALEAERRWGALQGQDHCAYVTWSTGIGVGLCVDGHVLRGKNGNAGHAGHMLCERRPHGRAVRLRQPRRCGGIWSRATPSRGVSALHRLRLLARRKRATRPRWRRSGELCRVMGRMLYNLVVTLDLQRISLGRQRVLAPQGAAVAAAAGAGRWPSGGAHGRGAAGAGRPGRAGGRLRRPGADGLRPIPRSARGPHICGSTPA